MWLNYGGITKFMRAIIVGTGAGGAVAARELTLNGFEVIILEAGENFKPFTRHLTWSEPLRRLGVLGSERTITKLFPALDTIRSSKDLILVRGISTGGSTNISCGNIVRADYGLKEIGLDLTEEFEYLEELIHTTTFPRMRWRPVTQQLYDAAENMGLKPQSTPKALDFIKCTSCGLCELGCPSGARWDARQFLNEAVKNNAKLYTNHQVNQLIIEDGIIKGVTGETHGKNFNFKSDIVILSAGGVGTAEILNNSNIKSSEHLWVDIVLTLGGVSKNADQLKKPPMVWYTKEEDYYYHPT